MEVPEVCVVSPCAAARPGPPGAVSSAKRHSRMSPRVPWHWCRPSACSLTGVGHGHVYWPRAELTVGLNNLKGLFHPKWFYDSIFPVSDAKFRDLNLSSLVPNLPLKGVTSSAFLQGKHMLILSATFCRYTGVENALVLPHARATTARPCNISALYARFLYATDVILLGK